MKKIVAVAILSLGVSLLLLASCGSDKNSTEACRYQTSLDLDRGNYDAVLSSSCADFMQIGAAWFGKAGYDMTNIINRFIDANESGTGVQKTDLNIYMTSLTGDVTDNTITYLDNAKSEYAKVTSGDGYQDAQFYISLVDSVKALSLIKTVIPESVNPDGTLNTSCDQNGNNVPDDADATACALRVSAGQACPNMTVAGDQTITLLNSAGTTTLNGQYRGLVIQGTGTTGTTAACPVPNEYKRLLFNNGSAWIAVAFTGSTCTEASTSASPGTEWPCPLESNNTPVDIVDAINESLDSSLSALSSAITSTTSTDVQQSIEDIKAQACCGGVTPCTTPCTSTTIADYLETNLQ